MAKRSISSLYPLIKLLKYYEEFVFVNVRDFMGQIAGDGIKLAFKKSINEKINKFKKNPADIKGYTFIRNKSAILDEYRLKIEYCINEDIRVYEEEIQEGKKAKRPPNVDFKIICNNFKRLFEGLYEEQLPFYGDISRTGIIMKKELCTLASNLIVVCNLYEKEVEKFPESERSSAFFEFEPIYYPEDYLFYKILISREKDKSDSTKKHLFQDEMKNFIDSISYLLSPNHEQSTYHDINGNRMQDKYDYSHAKGHLEDFFSSLSDSINSSDKVLTLSNPLPSQYEGRVYKLVLDEYIRNLKKKDKSDAAKMIKDFEEYSDILIEFDDKYFKVDNVYSKDIKDVPWESLETILRYAKLAMGILHILRNLQGLNIELSNAHDINKKETADE